MYVNLELDRASCLHRFRDVYESLGWRPEHLGSIDIWNLRGKSVPMDKLAPKLIRRAAKKDYVAIIIDPIYKVITGDENSATRWRTSATSSIKSVRNLAVRSSIVIIIARVARVARSPWTVPAAPVCSPETRDALLDLIELETTDTLMEQEENKAICKACIQYLDAHFEWADDLSQDDLCSKTQMLNYCQEHLDKWQMNALQKQIDQVVTDTRAKTAWRIEGTLREFPKFEPVNVWFHYPVHRLDDTGCLHDIQPEDERPPWKKGAENNKKSAKDRKEERRKALEAALENSNFGENPSVDDVAGYLGVSKRTARDRINEHGGYVIEGGIVRKKAEKQREGKAES